MFEWHRSTYTHIFFTANTAYGYYTDNGLVESMGQGRAGAHPSRVSGLSLSPFVFLIVKIKHMHRRAWEAELWGI